MFDVIVDIAFIAYDVYDIGKTLAKGERVSGTQVAALGADIIGAVVPGLTGGGAAVRAAAHADDFAKATTQAVKSAGNTVKAATIATAQIDKNTISASKAKTKEAKARQKEKERDAAKNKRQEHTSNARKSSEQKHEYGLTRKDQKYNDKKGHSPDSNKIQIKRNKI